MINKLWRKGLVFVIILLFVGVFITPATSYMTDNERYSTEFGLLDPYLNIEYDASSIPYAIEPESEIIEVPVNISYFVGGLFSGFIVPFLQAFDIEMLIELSLIDVPDWCNVSIQPDSINSKINYEPGIPHQSILSLSLSKDAPAWQEFSIGIKGTVEPLIGPFGYLTIIVGIEEETLISLTPGFYFDYLLEYESDIITPPLEKTNITMNLTNLGNGDLRVETNVVVIPEGFILTIPPLTVIPVDTTKQLLFQVQPPEDFINKSETIIYGFNLSSYGHPEAGYIEFNVPIQVHYP